ncbi:MAG TPA: energy-coupling factor transporter ATPase [Ktedonobacteraceae bacterium]
MSAAIIQARDLSYTYAAKRDAALRRPALQNVNLEIARGSCVAIIGVTGSGKSTLVQHFNGLLQPTSGSVVVDGIEVGASGADLVKLRRRVGLLFQFPEAQLFERSVFADIAFGPRHLSISRKEIRARVVEALEMVGLPHQEYGHRSPFELSGGQQRRVALATVLSMRPDILVLDEPGVGLDAEGKAEIYHCIQSLHRQGITVVLISHDMAEVASLAERLFVLHKSRLVLQGVPREIFAQPEVLRDYDLAPPPLYELLAQLRQRGLPVPADVMTVEEAFASITRIKGLHILD